MKIKTTLATAVILSLGVLIPTASFADKPARTEIDKIIAVVNDKIITQTELESEYQAFKKKMSHEKVTLPPRSVVEQKILDRLIYKNIQLQIAERANLTISNEEIDAAIKKMADANNLTLDQFKFALSKEGLEYNSYRENLKKQLVMNKLQQQAIKSKITVSDEEIEKLLKTENKKVNANAQYHIEHLVVPVSDKPTPKEWQAAKQKVLNFAKAIKDNKKTANKNNELTFEDFDWKKASELPTLFVSQLEKMKTNEISTPLRAANGFHLIKLLETKNDQKKMTKNQAGEILYQQKFEKEIMEWLEKMKKSSHVKVMI